ncbi:MAG: hypothetical protein C7N36_16975 [Bacteroidetes bacterium]|nr:MAG: hypothetical protein C7N36_16975 [Bacteroidota bacterium]
MEEVARPGVPEEERCSKSEEERCSKSEVGGGKSEVTAGKSWPERSRDHAHLSGRAFSFRRPLAQQAEVEVGSRKI